MTGNCVAVKTKRLVLETLKDVDKDRKCFRMIGGVLVERTVNEVVPALEQNKEQVNKSWSLAIFFLLFSTIKHNETVIFYR